MDLAPNGLFCTLTTNKNCFRGFLFTLEKLCLSSKRFLIQQQQVNSLQVMCYHDPVKFENWHRYDIDKFSYLIQQEEDFGHISLCDTFLMISQQNSFQVYSLERDSYRSLSNGAISRPVEKICNNGERLFILVSRGEFLLIDAYRGEVGKY